MSIIKPTLRVMYCQRLVNVYGISSCRQVSYLLVLVATFGMVGCWSHLGSDTEISDKNERIAAKVKVALAEEPELNAAPINVKVDDGIVTLGGFVEEEAQRQRASKATSRVKGVKSVVNKIQIK